MLALAHFGPLGAVPSAFYTVLCLVTTAGALPLRRFFDPRDPREPAPLALP